MVRTASIPRGSVWGSDGEVGLDASVGVGPAEPDRAAYWAQVNALRAERQRLNAS